ncbi:LemA family protein [Longimicrobium sp.]|uniref:LemA family protein n=1 Tax=Longimicrobium sp. TaxID=2029185 RepID=UPI002C48B1B6|nr:LemA family protein [Longimicrobium sp.]HSU12939.1 LemA family protein [Longimicrobium sp.]
MIIALVVLAVVVLMVILVYNGLVRLRLQAQNAWSDIDVQLKRRWDLIPNLVESVKGYASHERGTLESVTQARTQAMQAQGAGPAQRAQAEAQLTTALQGLTVAVEAYPQLQASGGFRDLQAQLAQIEDAVQNARRYYNAVVRDLNAKIMTFPSNLIAGPFGFHPREFFEAGAAEREVPKVAF